MPIETSLASSPYFDDHDDTKNFHKILFKPSVSVQVRELNNLQTLLSEQIERFGDNILKKGTILDGCNFDFHENYPYVKLLDQDIYGFPIEVGMFNGKFALDEDRNHVAVIVDSISGYESNDPDLNTIYVQYLNSGNNFRRKSFDSNRTLTIKDSNNSIYRIIVNNGSTGFSNSDSLVVTSAIVVNLISGSSISNNSYILNGIGANLQIIEVDTNTLESESQIILKIKPRDADLSNSSANSINWTFNLGDTIYDVGNNFTARIENILGTSCRGEIITNGLGVVEEVLITNGGRNYDVLPTVRIRSRGNSSGLSTLSLTAQNFLTKVRVASVGASTGNGYAFSVSSGIIYQKGYFIRAEPQTVIVSKYDTVPNNVAVGFRTNEEIIDSNIDNSLLDNTNESLNLHAPGADRLKLIPQLIVLDSEEAKANTEFFPLVEWSEGNAFRQNQLTEYNKIDDYISRRLYETSGNFVLDPFYVTTRSPSNTSFEGSKISVVVDPGAAYIDGERIRTESNFILDVDSARNTRIQNSETFSLNYGSYLIVKELGGLFQYTTGDIIKLYGTEKSFITNGHFSTNNTTPVGAQLGTARIRSMSLLQGTLGTADARYALYLFDIEMRSGRNFKNVKSVYYDGTNKGIADVVLSKEVTGSNSAIINDPSFSSLVFRTSTAGRNSISIKNANNVYYTYRDLDQTITAANTGEIIKDISSSTNEFFPYVGSWTTSNKRELYVVPFSNSLISNTLTGTLSVNTTSPNCIGTSTTFTTDYDAGDFIYLSPNGSINEIKQITRVVNNTLLILNSNVSFANATTNHSRCFPRNVPIPFGHRNRLGCHVTSNGSVMTLSFRHANTALMEFIHTGTVNVAIGSNIERRNIIQTTKTPNRNKFIKLNLSNNSATNIGPWSLGVPDAFRLRNVYIGSSSSVSNTDPNVTDSFYIDHNQNENYYGLSYLYKHRDSSLNLTSSDWLLIEFDYFTGTDGGFYNTVSYTSSNTEQILLVDSQPLSNLSSEIHSLEIPEFYSSRGQYFDLRECMDFRPYEKTTVTPHSSSGSAPINPGVNGSGSKFGSTSNPANNKKFPTPDKNLKADIEYWRPYRLGIYLNKDGNIFSSRKEGNDLKMNSLANDLVNDRAVKLNELYFPPYPNIPQFGSEQLNEIINQRIYNIRNSVRRFDDHTIRSLFTMEDIRENQPRVYTMEDIGKIDRRLQDVEYYVSLSLLESDIKNRNIPSSLDASLNRFKYGFFVDEFNDSKYTDIDSPIHSSIIEYDDVVPDKFTWSVDLYGRKHDGTRKEVLLLEQSNATEKEDPCDLSSFIGNSDTINAIAINYDNKRNSHTNLFQLREIANSISNMILVYDFYNDWHGIEIYQGNTLIAATTDSSNLSNSDKNRLKEKNNRVPENMWNSDENNYVLLSNNFILSGNTTHAKYSGKIEWTHIPNRGSKYTIKKLIGTGKWKYSIEYKTDSNNIDIDKCGPIVNSTSNTTVSKTIKYNGTMTIDPDYLEYIFTIIEGGDPGGEE